MRRVTLGMDMHELNVLNSRLKKESRRQAEITKGIERVIRKHITMLKRRTPVKTGRLKAHWDWDNENIVVERAGDWYRVTIMNAAKNPKDNVYYGSFVEKGHRKVVFGHDTGGWVQGRFFVRSTEVETEANLEKNLAPYIEKWWEGLHIGK